MSKREYLGDGVYAVFDGWSIVLTTEDGISVQNTIVLEPEVMQALLAFVERLREGLRGAGSPFVRRA